MSGTLFVVGTPIGNLDDISLRALRVLGECDAVIAEDSRRTRVLLSKHGLRKKIVSLPAFAEYRRIPRLLDRLEAGESLALCTDAGTPGVSDPGASVVQAAREAGHSVIPVPGASALTVAISASGLVGSPLYFLGFLPRAPSKLRKVLAAACATDATVVFFESPLRVQKTLRLAGDMLGSRRVVVARELTKVHEQFYIGTANELATQFAQNPVRGECTVMVGGQ